jgi:hypothetical protein
MPLQDWTRVPAGTFHAFHNAWITELQRALNSGILPSDFYALGEQWAGDIGPDVLTLHLSRPSPLEPTPGLPGRVRAVAAEPPQVRYTQQASQDAIHYLSKQRTLVIRHITGDRVVALVEIVSPGNKQSRPFLDQLLAKALSALQQGCHLLVVDPLPAGALDPQGIHERIWQAATGEPFELPQRDLRTLAAYHSVSPPSAYVELAELADPLSPMPLFLSGEEYVNVPLEETYEAASASMPAHVRRAVEPK